jgi:hypothetical protein
LCGAILFSLSLGIRTLLVSGCNACLKFDSTVIEYVRPVLRAETGLAFSAQTRRAEWVITSAYSLLLGAGCGVIANLFTPRQWALRRSVNAFDRLLLQAYFKGFLVSLTLRTSTVYVGVVATLPDPTRESVIVTLLTMLSGNRDAEGRVTLTTDYERVYSTLKAGRAKQLCLPADWESRFKLLIRADEIVTAALFLPEVYTEFNPDWKQQITQPSQEPSRIQVRSSIGTNLRFSGPM